MHDPCIPVSPVHADNSIICSISEPGSKSITKQTLQRRPILPLLLSSLCHCPLRHSLTFITIVILFLHPPVPFFSVSPSHLSLPPPHHRLSVRVVERWRIDWMPVSLWEMSLLMWRTGLVPYSSVSLWITRRLYGAAVCEAAAHLPPFKKSNGAQNESWI